MMRQRCKMQGGVSPGGGYASSALHVASRSSTVSASVWCSNAEVTTSAWWGKTLNLLRRRTWLGGWRCVSAGGCVIGRPHVSASHAPGGTRTTARHTAGTGWLLCRSLLLLASAACLSTSSPPATRTGPTATGVRRLLGVREPERRTSTPVALSTTHTARVSMLETAPACTALCVVASRAAHTCSGSPPGWPAEAETSMPPARRRLQRCAQAPSRMRARDVRMGGEPPWEGLHSAAACVITVAGLPGRHGGTPSAGRGYCHDMSDGLARG